MIDLDTKNTGGYLEGEEWLILRRIRRSKRGYAKVTEHTGDLLVDACMEWHVYKAFMLCKQSCSERSLLWIHESIIWYIPLTCSCISSYFLIYITMFFWLLRIRLIEIVLFYLLFVGKLNISHVNFRMLQFGLRKLISDVKYFHLQSKSFSRMYLCYHHGFESVPCRP